jgi:hypothetical protein
MAGDELLWLYNLARQLGLKEVNWEAVEMRIARCGRCNKMLPPEGCVDETTRRAWGEKLLRGECRENRPRQ